MPQLNLPFSDRRTIEERFTEFHKANPHVMRLLVQLAREAKDSGATKLGMRMLWERLRWSLVVETQDESGFKLNDHYPPLYSRLIMANHPELDGLFEVRERKAR